MSDTPETDRLAEEFKRNTLPDDVKLHVLFGYTRKLEKGFDETLRLGNKLADECERILGLGLHQNTIERFKLALNNWKEKNKMSDTPETDAEEDASHNFAELVVPSSLARRLERERDEARDTVEQLTEHGLDLMDANRMLKRELKRLKGNTK
jgi:hypothetical protein